MSFTVNGEKPLLGDVSTDGISLPPTTRQRHGFDVETGERRGSEQLRRNSLLNEADEDADSVADDTLLKLHQHSHVHHMTADEQKLMQTYESLDYDQPQNILYRQERMHLDSRVNSRVNIARWLVFALIGFLTGTLAYLISKGVEILADWKFDSIRDRLHEGDLLGPFFIFIAFSVGFVLVATFLVAVIEPVSGGSGIPEIKGYLNGTNYLRFLRLKTLVCKAVGVVFSVSGGLAIGKEGPLVHSGAIFAANLSHMTYLGQAKCVSGRCKRWVYRFRNDRDKRDFVSGGAAAGVAAAFGSPVGGILFSLEEASSFWSIDLTWRVFLCSMLGTFFLNVWKVLERDTNSFSGLISFGPALQSQPYRLWETPFFVLLAMFGGLHGAMFNAINNTINKWRRNHLLGKAGKRMLEACSVALITAVLCFWVPYFFPSCRPIPAADQRFMEEQVSTACIHRVEQLKGFTHTTSVFLFFFFSFLFVLTGCQFLCSVPMPRRRVQHHGFHDIRDHGGCH